jgi:Domain of unknown function (DUF5615)
LTQLDADEGFSSPVVQSLRQLGHDILTAHEAGQAGRGITNAAVVALATARGRAVVTCSRRPLSACTWRYRRTQASSCAPVTTMWRRWLTASTAGSRVLRSSRVSCYGSTVPVHSMCVDRVLPPCVELGSHILTKQVSAHTKCRSRYLFSLQAMGRRHGEYTPKFLLALGVLRIRATDGSRPKVVPLSGWGPWKCMLSQIDDRVYAGGAGQLAAMRHR